LHYRLLVFILVFFFSWTGLKAQRDSISILKNQSRLADTTQIRKTTGLGIDTIPQISIKKAFDTIPSRKTVKISETGLEDRVKFGAVDTQWIDKKTQTVYLKGKAYVNYQDKSIKADYIELQLQKKLAEARRLPDMPGSEKAIFTDGGNEYAYNALKYNFETEKGLVMDAVMKEGEFIIHGARTKYLKDSTDNRKGAIINNANGLVTTCQHDEPHFGIRAKKMKLVSDRLAVFGPSNLELGGVPTPVIIPFGFYPLVEGKSSGFIFPQDYQFNSRSLGFGLLGFGWYFPISDYVHVKLTADLYTRGTHAIYANTSYRKRYKYQGTIRLSYNDRRTDGVQTIILNGEERQQATVISDKGYSISIDHRQDSKAHPFIDVGGRINIVGNNNQNRNFNDARSVLTNTYTSNFYYRHKMPGTPFSFNMGLNHNQNTQTGVVNITLPDIQLNMNTIYPFERKNRGSNKQKWYEKISFDYDLKLKSFVQATDSTLFTQEMYDDIKTGMNHAMVTGFSTRLFKYFNFVPRANYEETWVLNTIDKRLEQTSSFQDSLVTDVVGGFDSFRKYSAGLSVNTQIFGTAEFRKGWLRGIRHTMKPEIGYSYAPDTRSTYRDTVYYSDNELSPEIYTRFDDGPFSSPNFTELQSQMNFRLNNIIELKHWSRKDSTTKKFKIFDNITVSGNYNFARDSLKWSRISVNSTSRFFNGMTTVISSWSFDPYIEVNNRIVNKTVWSENGAPLRMESGQVRLSNRITLKKILKLFEGSKDEQPSDPQLDTSNDDIERTVATGPPDISSARPGEGQEEEKKQLSFRDILENISIDHNLLYSFTADDGEITSELRTHAISFTGRIPLTENWNINIGNLGYDFVNKGLSYTAITFSRKLHCWDMNFSWYPNRDTYSFSIGVSSNVLSFLKYNYGQNNIDGLIGRF